MYKSPIEKRRERDYWGSVYSDQKTPYNHLHFDGDKVTRVEYRQKFSKEQSKQIDKENNTINQNILNFLLERLTPSLLQKDFPHFIKDDKVDQDKIRLWYDDHHISTKLIRLINPKLTRLHFLTPYTTNIV